MSELINTHGNHADIRKRLLATVSLLAFATVPAAHASDSSRPTVWIELGGQMEMMQGTYSPFTAPFMATAPEPDSYDNDIFSRNQKPARSSFGLEGSATFQPEDSDWKFSAGIRYGRARAKHHGHQQGAQHAGYKYRFATPSVPVGMKQLYVAAFADAQLSYRESHMVLDFSAGKDIGIGMMGRSGSSSINAGVRFAQFSTQANVSVSARPSVSTAHVHRNNNLFVSPYAVFNNYILSGSAERNFHGVGPSLSWNASAALLGNSDDGELTLDWGVNGAVLFGRQRAGAVHGTQAYQAGPKCKRFAGNGNCAAFIVGTTPLYSNAGSDARSHSVTVPNLGGFAGFSVKYPNVKVSFGYRADFFFGAVDAGIDQRQTKSLGFQGPFATVSIGLGG